MRVSNQRLFDHWANAQSTETMRKPSRIYKAPNQAVGGQGVSSLIKKKSKEKEKNTENTTFQLRPMRRQNTSIFTQPFM
jgi:hypothetical protein